MSTTISAIPPGVNVGAIGGPLLIGWLLNTMLFGILCVQVYIYYMAFPHDPLVCKCLVYGVFLVELVQTILLMHDAFLAFGSGFGNMEALTAIHLSWLGVPILGGIVSCPVQMFYAYRINILSGYKIIGIGIVLISLLQCGAAISVGVRMFQLGNFSKLQDSNAVFVGTNIWLAGSAACDIVIAICMTFFLSRKNSTIKSTHALVNRLISLTVETGAVTALSATINLILFVSFPNTTYYTTPAIITAKLYTNTCLVIFNNRVSIRGGRGYNQTEDTQRSSIFWSNASGLEGVNAFQRRQTVVVSGADPARTGDGASTPDIVIDVGREEEVWDDNMHMGRIKVCSDILFSMIVHVLMETHREE